MLFCVVLFSIVCPFGECFAIVIILDEFSSKNAYIFDVYMCVLCASVIKIGNNMVSVQSLNSTLSLSLNTNALKRHLGKNESFVCMCVLWILLTLDMYWDDATFSIDYTIFDFMSITIANIQWHNLLIVLTVNNKSPLQKAHDKNALELHTYPILQIQQQRKKHTSNWLVS